LHPEEFFLSALQRGKRGISISAPVNNGVALASQLAAGGGGLLVERRGKEAIQAAPLLKT
jgi:hypothetical protein